MLRRIWIIAIVCLNISYGTLLNAENQKDREFLQLQVKIEFTITIERENLFQEANKLDSVLAYFHQLVDKRAKQIETTVTHHRVQAKSLNRSINHCIKGIKLMSKNLDLYNLHQCKKIPYYINDNLLAVKKLSMTIPKRKTDCLVKYSQDSQRLRLCLESALYELDQKQLSFFRVIRSHKDIVLKNGLNCIQENYNILNRELCLLTCQFEECVSRKCKPRLQNKLVLEKPPYYNIPR